MRRLYKVAWTAVTVEAAAAAVWGYFKWLRPYQTQWGATAEGAERLAQSPDTEGEHAGVRRDRDRGGP